MNVCMYIQNIHHQIKQVTTKVNNINSFLGGNIIKLIPLLSMCEFD